MPYCIIFYQNILGIVIKSIQEISDSSKPHTHFKRESFESIISFLTYRGNANIAETYEANRRAWRSCTTLSCLYSIIIPFRDSRAFLHDQADRGTQRPGYGLDLFRSSYCGRQNHRRFWLPRWKPRPLRLTLRSRNHPG